MANGETQHWSLDRRIPLALIIMLALQTAGFTFYMGSLSQRVDQNERTLERGSGAGDRLTRLEVQLDNIQKAIARVERRLDGEQ